MSKHVMLIDAALSHAVAHLADTQRTTQEVVWATGFDILLHLLGYPFQELDADRCFAELVRNCASRQGASAAVATGWDITVSGGQRDVQVVLHLPANLAGDDPSRHGAWLLSLVGRLIDSPATPVKQFDVLGLDEVAVQLERARGSRATYPRDARIEALCFDRAASDPHKIAVIDGSIELTFAQLCERAEMLAAELRDLGVETGESVVLLMPRSASIVVAALAVLRTGGVYVPVDPEYPHERIRYLLEDSGARYLVRQAGGAAIETGVAAMVLELDCLGALEHVCACPNQRPARRIAAAPDPAFQPAYLMYTSGSTGQPKGVPVSHRGVVRLAYGLDDLTLDTSTVMLYAGAVGFDSTVFEMWCALIHGGCLCIATRNDLLDSDSLKVLLVRHKVNTLFMTPALFAMHADREATLFAPLRQIVLGGDRFPVRQAEIVARACPDLVFANGYGPTENTVFSTMCQVVPSAASAVSIGRPIGHSTAYVLLTGAPNSALRVIRV